MADKPADRSNQGGQVGHAEHLALNLLANLLTHGVPEVVKWGWTKGTEQVDEGIKDQQRRSRNKNYFQAAMVKLRTQNPAAADVVDDFDIKYLGSDPDRADNDREDFQVNAARTGGDEDDKMSDTVQFLEQLATLPDHQAREALLVARGYIGARSIDIKERATAMLKAVRDGAKSLPSDARKAINEQLKTLDQSPTGKKLKQHATDQRTRLKTRLKKAWNQ